MEIKYMIAMHESEFKMGRERKKTKNSFNIDSKCSVFGYVRLM